MYQIEKLLMNLLESRAQGRFGGAMAKLDPANPRHIGVPMTARTTLRKLTWRRDISSM
jgi:hypothetical protein